MPAQLVRAEDARERGVPGHVSRKRLAVPPVVDPLLKLARKPRREALPAHAKPAQLRGDVDVVDQCRRVLHLVDRHLELQLSLRRCLEHVPVHRDDLGYRQPEAGRSRDEPIAR